MIKEQLINKFINVRKINFFLSLGERFCICDIEKKQIDYYLYIQHSIAEFLGLGLIEKKEKEGRKVFYILTETGKEIRKKLEIINALFNERESEGSEFE